MRPEPGRAGRRVVCRALAAALAALLGACGGAPTLPARPPAAIEPVTVAEAFVTPESPADEIDSVATWHAADGTVWLLATAKRGARVLVYDAATGTALGTLDPADGVPLSRPNGIAVADDVAFVVDQQGRRVEMLHLPDGRRLGTLGETVLRNPYGIWVHARPGTWDVYVTDSYRLDDGRMPPPEQLGRRVRHFRVSPGAVPRVRSTRAFGETRGSGMLLTVESIAGDPRHDRLLVAEEQLDAASGLRVYRSDGRYTGTSIAAGVFAHQAEGIVLLACADGSGFWVASDQHPEQQRFHVFDRASLRWLASFRGRIARDTDGLAFERGPLPGFPDGLLYAQHDNRAVVAFDWGRVARALDLEPGCG
jgi:3-phytase